MLAAHVAMVMAAAVIAPQTQVGAYDVAIDATYRLRGLDLHSEDLLMRYQPEIREAWEQEVTSQRR